VFISKAELCRAPNNEVGGRQAIASNFNREGHER